MIVNIVKPRERTRAAAGGHIVSKYWQYLNFEIGAKKIPEKYQKKFYKYY